MSICGTWWEHFLQQNNDNVNMIRRKKINSLLSVDLNIQNISTVTEHCYINKYSLLQTLYCVCVCVCVYLHVGKDFSPCYEQKAVIKLLLIDMRNDKASPDQ